MTWQKSKKKSVFLITKARVVLFLLIAIVLGVSVLFSAPIENFYQKIAGETKVNSSATIIENSELSVFVVDCGQGDCIMIDLPDGKNVMIDASENNKVISEHIIEFANLFLIDEGECLDYLILTHSHSDHVGNMDDVLDNFEVKNVVRPPEFYYNEKDTTGLNDLEAQTALDCGATLKGESYNVVSTAVMKSFLSKAYAEPDCNMIVTTNDQSKLNINGHDSANVNYQFTFYTADDSEYYNPTNSIFKNSNNYSPLIVLEYDGLSMAFTGDMEKDMEAYLISKYTLPDVDFLKVGHHGSDTSTSDAFVKEITPNYAFISVGEGNKYGHPKDITYTTLNSNGIDNSKIFETMNYGDLVIGFNYTQPGDVANEGGSTLTSASNMAIGISKGEYTPAVIKWWYIAVSLIVLSAILLLLTPSASKKAIKAYNKSHK